MLLLVLQSALLGASWDACTEYSHKFQTLERSDVMTEMRALMITRVIVSGISLAIGFAFGQSRNRRTLTAVAAPPMVSVLGVTSAFLSSLTVKMVEKDCLSEGSMRIGGTRRAFAVRAFLFAVISPPILVGEKGQSCGLGNIILFDITKKRQTCGKSGGQHLRASPANSGRLTLHSLLTRYYGDLIPHARAEFRPAPFRGVAGVSL